MFVKLFKAWRQRFQADDLIRHAVILFGGMAVVHACNLLFQMAVSRALPEREYALLAAFLGLLAMLQLPLSTLSAAVGHYSSLLCRDGRTGDVRRLVRKWLLVAGIPSMVLGMIALVVRTPLAQFLHLERSEPVVIAALILPALFSLPILGGASQGVQQFGWNTISGISGALARLGLGAGFVWFLYPACGWAMLGHGIGAYVTAAGLMTGLWIVFRHVPSSGGRLPSMRFYILQSIFMQGAYAVLMTADVVLVKHFLPDEASFAYAATLSRLIVFLPGAVVTAMFPKVASVGAVTSAQHRIFVRSMRYTAICILPAVVACVLAPGILLSVLFGLGSADGALKGLVAMMALTMGLNAMLKVVLQFLLARRLFRKAVAIVPLAFGYVAGAFLFHTSPWMIVLLSGTANAMALALLWRAASDRPS